LLEREYAAQLEGFFDIGLDRPVAGLPGSHLNARERLVRAKIVAAIERLGAAGDAAEGVSAFLREAAFTTLNRFVALKMLEARGLIQQCISRGEESVGFKEFSALAPGLIELPDHGYRLYIESIFDEIAREVRVLFDRRDPAGLLWPRRKALLELLEILNHPDLAAAWAEDETIGWVYQYFNSHEEREAMRTASPAPRNSRELAVRNQFFTPRYVVRFLTDNTLGRIWYEMRRGRTRLSELPYLVRHPHEIFLSEGEKAPVSAAQGRRGRDEPLARPVPIPFRAGKDPRDIRVLDPACGSGHFLLYAFDLLLIIYEEAWADDAWPPSEATGRSLREDYPSLDELHSALPGLILRHNLHGIDIDARCAQIAALALWLRAQRAYNDLGIARHARPPIRKTNIVVAEPMPGDPRLRREFAAALEPKLGALVERVFESMEPAGEAGSLLRIEEDLEKAVRELHSGFGDDLFRSQTRLIWQRAMEKLLLALERIAERSADSSAFKRRLFAEDTGRGLGFIELCRQRYDVVLMNPPFGAFPERLRSWAASVWPRTKNDILGAFVERGLQLLHPGGRLGAITSRTAFFLPSFRKWREEVLLKHAPPVVVADLGHGVMDDAMVEAAAYCLEVLR
jgi:hypothetical protein